MDNPENTPAELSPEHADIHENVIPQDTPETPEQETLHTMDGTDEPAPTDTLPQESELEHEIDLPAKRGRKKKEVAEEEGTLIETPVVKKNRSKKAAPETPETISEETIAEPDSNDTEALDNTEPTVTDEPIAEENQDITAETAEISAETLTEASPEISAETEVIVSKKASRKEEKAEEIPPLVSAAMVEECNLSSLIEMTESVLENEDFSRVKDAMILLKKRFELIESTFEQETLIKDSEPKEDEEEVTEDPETTMFKEDLSRFKQLLNTYSKLRKQHNERIEAEKLRNYDLKKQILEDMKLLVESEETLQKSWEDFKRLQQQWKEIGHVPPAQSQDLWNSFNHLVDLFLDKVKINRELRDLDYRKNLEAKLEICEKTEELLLTESIDEAFSRLGDLQNKWRETGPVPSDKRDEINGRFANVIDKLKEKRRERYETFRAELDNNLNLKKALVVQIKAINEQEIQSAKQWGKKTEEVEELMKFWKNAGPVPKKFNEEIWSEFRQEMARFFQEKKAFFGKMKDELMENYNRKQLLCKQAESLQESTDWKKSTLELIALQNEWKTIGPVPHRYSDNIWKQFRAACDVFFARKKEFFSSLDKHEEENLKAKLELIEQMNTFEFGTDSKENLEAIKDFQRKFFDIGRVPIKEKDKIHSSFQKTIDSLLDKLNIGREEKRRYDMKQKYEHMSTSKGGQADLKKDTFNIAQKISKLDSDIQLWENNIEFFAKSKNADLLTREFREKIEKAKAELLVLKEKQKMMRNMSN